MTEFKIEKNIPIPPRKRGGAQSKYRWREMEVGDSFFVPDTTVARFAGAVSSARKATGFKFLTRSVDGGVRVWREDDTK